MQAGALLLGGRREQHANSRRHEEASNQAQKQ
jgi:hypothetical protein